MSDGLISLIQFDRTFLTSIRSRLRLAAGERAHDFVLGEMVEAYFWVLLGIELQAFPAREAELLIRQRFTEMFSTWQYLFARRGYLFPPSFEIGLRIAENQARVIAINEGRQFTKPEALTGLFHHALTLETESAADPVLTTFFASLSVLGRPDLENILYKGQNLEGILFLKVDESLLTETFVQAARHMDSFRIVDELSRVDSEIGPHDAVLFRLRTSELTRWRLNFHLDSVRDFLPTIATRCNLQLPEEFRIPTPELSDWLAKLIADWGYTHEIGRSAA